MILTCERCGRRFLSRNATETEDGMVCKKCIDDYVECADCGKLIRKEHANTTVAGRYICEECNGKNYFVCDECGTMHRIDEEHIAYKNGEEVQICATCRFSKYYICECCGQIVHYTDTRKTYDGGRVCDECVSSSYYICNDCGRYVHEDEVCYCDEEGVYYCPDCYNNDNRVIYDYHDFDTNDYEILTTEKEPIEPRTYGFELEVSGDRDYASEFLKYFNQDEREVILMNDSSIRDGGFEIITMPMTENYFYEVFLDKFKKGLNFLQRNYFEGHNCGGLHIHINPPPNSVLAQLSLLMYKNNKKEREIWKQLTQRTEDNLHWCSFDEEPIDFYEILERDCVNRLTINQTRYVALNCDNRTETYEFRIFNSNIRIERFLKNFEIAKSLLDYCDKFKHERKPAVSMEGYLKFIDENKVFYQNLYEFISEKGIKYEEPYETELVRTGTDDIDEIEIPF